MFTGLTYLMRDRMQIPFVTGVRPSFTEVILDPRGTAALFLDTGLAVNIISWAGKQAYRYATNTFPVASVAPPTIDEFRQLVAEHALSKTSPALIMGSTLLGTAGAFILKDITSRIQQQFSKLSSRKNNNTTSIV